MADPLGGLVPNQAGRLDETVTSFKDYLTMRPEAKLILLAHADERGGAAFKKALSQRRADCVKSYLVDHGIPASAIDTEAFGTESNFIGSAVDFRLGTTGQTWRRLFPNWPDYTFKRDIETLIVKKPRETLGIIFERVSNALRHSSIHDWRVYGNMQDGFAVIGSLETIDDNGKFIEGVHGTEAAPSAGGAYGTITEVFRSIFNPEFAS